MSLVNITRGETLEGTPFGVQAINLQVEGQYFDLEDFFYRLENYVDFHNNKFRAEGRLLQLVSIQVTNDASAGNVQSSSPTLQATVNMNAYLQPAAATAREVRNDPEQAHAHVHRHRPHRGRGAGLRRSPLAHRFLGEHPEPDAGGRRHGERVRHRRRRARRGPGPQAAESRPVLEQGPVRAARRGQQHEHDGHGRHDRHEREHQPERQDQGERHGLHGVGRRQGAERRPRVQTSRASRRAT